MEQMTSRIVFQTGQTNHAAAANINGFGTVIPVSPEERQPTLLVPRVLVVDDNVDARNSLALLLREHGYVVLTAHDGYSAIERATEFKPHAVLLDIVMPGISGFKVAEMLRKQPALADTLLISVTGYQQSADDWLSKNAGCDYHFEKPLEFAVLDQLLKTKLT